MRPDLRRLIYLAAGAGLLFGASRFVEPINRRRNTEQLVAAPLDQTASPDMVASALMAVGRAPLVDYLWLRAVKLKEQRRFFDALQLSETICRLQPRFGPVWAFNAWNMSYNISVTFDTPEDRWRWVRNGIELLRDKGIPMNPRNVQLYRELAWIYFHKVADYMDEMHWYYKNEFALLMEDVLGLDDTCDYAALAAAPHEWAQVMRNEDAAAFVQAASRVGADVSQPGVLLGVLNHRAELARQVETTAEPPPLWAVLDDPARAAGAKLVEYYWRSKRLREDYKLDPQRIHEIREAYGPMDFRLAEAHAFYWSYLGSTLGVSHKVRMDIDRLNADRIQLYAIQNMFRRGRLVMSPDARKGGLPLVMCDTRFVPVLIDYFKQTSQRYLKDEPVDAPVSMNFDSAYKNFMRDAITACYEAGEAENAQKYFDQLKSEYPHEDFERGVAPFVTNNIIRQMEVMTVHQSIYRVAGYIHQALVLLAYGRDREGYNYLRLARAVNDQYNETVTKRSNLPPFDRMVAETLRSLQSQLRPDARERLNSKLERAGVSAASRPAEERE